MEKENNLNKGKEIFKQIKKGNNKIICEVVINQYILIIINYELL